MKKNWKRFFTLSRAAGGFTLVELIVVIAILAILAGVAVPAYSGYITKANEAADTQLLASLNTAFAAACAINGEDNYRRTDNPRITIAEGGEVATTALKTGNEKIDASFATFFEGGTFKSTVSLVYDIAFGGFKNPATAENLTVAYGGGFVTLTGAGIAALKNSTYNDLTNEELLNQVDSATGIATQLNAMQNILKSDGFQTSAAQILGLGSKEEVDAKKTELAKQALRNKDEYKDLSDADFEAALKANPDVLSEAELQVMGNALVLYTAQQTTNTLTQETARDLLKGATMDSILANFNGSETQQQTGMNQSALAYGMYYAYVNSGAEGSSGLEKNDIQPTDVLSILGDENFNKYLDSDQGKADMEAYLAALEMVNSSTSSSSAVENLMINGFNDPALVEILNQAIGN